MSATLEYSTGRRSISSFRCPWLLCLALSACSGADGDEQPGNRDAGEDASTHDDAGSRGDAGEVVDAGSREDGSTVMPDGGNDGGSDGGQPPDPDLASAEIGPEGGTLGSTDGRLTISVPAGAVAAATTFAIRLVHDAPVGVRQGIAYELTPHDVVFRRSVTVVLSYDAAIVEGDEADLTLLVLDPASAAWNLVEPVEVDVDADTLTTERAEFSVFSYGSFNTAVDALGFDSIEAAPSTIYVSLDGDDDHTGFTNDDEGTMLSVQAACGRMTAGRYYAFAGKGVSYASVRTIVLGGGTFEVDDEDLTCFAGLVGQGRTLTRLRSTSGELRIWLGNRGGAYAITFEGVDVVGSVTDGVDGAFTVRDVRMSGFSDTGIELDWNATVEDSLVELSLFESECIRVNGEDNEIRNTTVRSCEIGIAARDAMGLAIEDSTVTNTLIGILFGGGFGFSLEGSTVRDNDTGLEVQGTVTTSGNTIACNDEVDVATTRDAATVTSTGDAWDHVPPLPVTAGDEFANDYDGAVTASSPVLAVNPCAGPPSGPCEDIVSERTAMLGPVGGVIHLGETEATACTVFILDAGGVEAPEEFTLATAPDDPSDYVFLPPDFIADETRQVILQSFVTQAGVSRVELRDHEAGEAGQHRSTLRSNDNLNLLLTADSTTTGCAQDTFCHDLLGGNESWYVGNRHLPSVKPRSQQGRSFTMPHVLEVSGRIIDIAADFCGPASAQCVDGGAFRYTELAAADCSEVGTIEDELQLFLWGCAEDESAGTLAISHGFAPGKGLRDAIDFASDEFRPNRVTARDGADQIITQTPLEIWFFNPILDFGAQPEEPHQILLVGNRTTVIPMNTDYVALVSRPGTAIAIPGSPTGAVLPSGLSWLEVDIDGNGGYGVYANGTPHLSVRNSTITGVNVGVYVRQASGFTGADLNLQGNNIGVYVDQSPRTQLERVRAVDNTGTGIWVADSAGVVLSNATVTGSNTGVSFSGNTGGSIASGILALGNAVGISLDANSLLRNSVAALSQNAGVAVPTGANGVRIERTVSLLNGAGYDLDATGTLIVDSGASENVGAGFDASTAVTFQGDTWSANNGAFFAGDSCAPLANADCAGVLDAGGGVCAFGPGATVLADPPLLDAFTGAIAEPSNASAPNGTAVHDAITDWFTHGSELSGFGRAGTVDDYDCGARGKCTGSDTCQVYDFGAVPAGPAIRVVANASGDDAFAFVQQTGAASAAACTAAYPGSSFAGGSCTSTSLESAVELLLDAAGDDDGLCESDERCAFTPNLGVDQGLHTALASFPFSDGQLTGVQLYAGTAP
jgi:hypothetical protein